MWSEFDNVTPVQKLFTGEAPPLFFKYYEDFFVAVTTENQENGDSNCHSTCSFSKILVLYIIKIFVFLNISKVNCDLSEVNVYPQHSYSA